jgi:ferredoxin-type protein NapF
VSPRAGGLLRIARIAVALAVFAVLAGTFLDFAGWLPSAPGRALAAAQFVPSALALAGGAALSIACVFIVLATLVAGRLYCSILCPLGILQDIVFRARKILRHKPLRFAKPRTVLRFAILGTTIAILLAGGSGLVLPFVDPYSHFGRIAADLFRPLATFGNNAWIDATDALGFSAGSRYEVVWAPVGALVFSGVVLAIVAVLAWRRGRLYCNTFCPVGTLLGWLAKRSAFRLAIDASACRKCAECLGACKSQCIDLRAASIDASRCVSCFDCLATCRHGAIDFRLFGKPASFEIQKPGQPARASFPRRAFLAHTAVTIGALTAPDAMARPRHDGANRRRHGDPITPPGSLSLSRFLDRCTACHLCVSACPTHVLQPATLEYGLSGWLKPRLDYTKAFCNFDCRRCGEVCPDGAIDLLDLAAKHITKIGHARLDLDRCIVVTHGTDCAACSEHCPTKAVSTVPYRDNLRKPTLAQKFCIGCGACEFACPVRAITVSGLATHGKASQIVEPKAALPESRDDFPF